MLYPQSTIETHTQQLREEMNPQDHYLVDIMRDDLLGAETVDRAALLRTKRQLAAYAMLFDTTLRTLPHGFTTAPERTVLVDMDGVLADFNAGIDAGLRVRLPEVTLPDVSPYFYYEDNFADPAHKQTVRDINCAPGFFAELAPVPGFREGWQAIKDAGYEPRICTSPLLQNLWCIADKLLWLEHHLGADVARQAYVTRDKSSASGIALIDDRPSVNYADRADWKHIMFDQVYNGDIDTPLRLRGWSDPALPELLDACRETY